MPTPLDLDRLRRELLLYLSGQPTSGKDAARALGISQPAFSRLTRQVASDLLVIGRARSVRYAAYRDIPAVGRRLPLYEIDEAGGARQLAYLHATRPNGFFVEALVNDIQSQSFDDLPYFLHDLRPSGFLGRLLPARHPELGAPPDIQHWTGNDCLRYLTRHGWNSSGNLVLGDQAFRLYLAQRTQPPAVVSSKGKGRTYAAFADDVLRAGPAGSSAGGEQPKFIAWRDPGQVEVMVKFSPPTVNPLGRRLADLLIAEHVAHQILRAHGRQAARSEIVEGQDRLFLEIERFDRTAAGGRRGLLSLLALDAEFVGRLNSWTDSATHLAAEARLSPLVRDEIAWIEVFGRLIANSDMHPANLSFVTRGTRVLGLAPIYDMLPMAYAPRQAQIPRVDFVAPIPDPTWAAHWKSAHEAALAFWAAVQTHSLISVDFRRIAKANLAVLERAKGVGALLPSPVATARSPATTARPRRKGA